jgi:hypothetical protein
LADQLERTLHIDPGGVEIVLAGSDTRGGCRNYNRFVPSLHQSEWPDIRIAKIENSQVIPAVAKASADAIRMPGSVSA